MENKQRSTLLIASGAAPAARYSRRFLTTRPDGLRRAATPVGITTHWPADRVAASLPQLVDEVAALAARVDGHLKKMEASWK